MPSKGQVFVKAAYRCLGTLTGAGFAFLIIPLANHVISFLCALCIWVALCAFIACLLRGFRSYCAQLAGYTATIIGGFVLISPSIEHDGVAVERLVMVFTGIAVSAILTVFFAPDADLRRKDVQLQALKSRAIKRAGELIGKNQEALGPDFWNAIAEFESDYAFAAIESRSARRRLVEIRQALAAMTTFLAAVRALTGVMDTAHGAIAEVLRVTFDDVSAALQARTSARGSIQALSETAARLMSKNLSPSLQDRAVATKLRDVCAALTRIVEPHEIPELLTTDAIFAIPQFHHDWSRSGSVALRTLIAMGLMAVLWVQTGAGVGWIFAFVMTSVACCLFGTFPGSRQAMKGFAIAVGAAVACFLVFAVCQALFAFEASMAVAFLTMGCLLGCVPLANGYKRAMDYNTNFTVLMLGVSAQSVPLFISLETGLAMVVGILVSYLVFRVPFRGDDARFTAFKSQITCNLARLDKGRGIKPQTWESYMNDVVVQVSLSNFSREQQRALFAWCQQTLDSGLELIAIERRKALARLDARQCEQLETAMADVEAGSLGSRSQSLLDLATSLLASESGSSKVSGTQVQQIAASLAYLGLRKEALDPKH
ncbi:hypothetical protein C4K03_3054 [Pseudomonas synxantha]|uniref:FUSC family protein n=2 Tax=Pseudomonas synxantha TaxID=47883 RepID=A0A3G7U9J3_9PSED|nr:hypothetical protein C4K03_3054 [Pseudomonas synxantha]